MTVAAEVTVAALDQAREQPALPLRAARVPLRVVAADLLDAVERVPVDDRRDRDRDPLLAWALAVAGLAVPRAARPSSVSRRL